MKHTTHTAPIVAVALLITGGLAAASPPSPRPMPPPDNQKLAHDIFKEIVEVRSVHDVGTRRVADILVRYLKAAGFTDSDVHVLAEEKYPNQVNVVVRLTGNGKARPILWNGHMDVVEAKPQDWSLPPFQFIEKDSYFYGRAVEGVTSQDQFAPGAQGDPAVRVRIYRPDNHPSKLPALYWIHGGGYVMGDIEQDDRLMKQLAKRISCVAVSVDYRLAPEHPFPAPIEDCYAGLKWLFGHAEELGVDRSRVAIGGASGGGGLCAGLALLARDRGEVCPAFQLLIFPLIDDRHVTPASCAITDPRMWNRESNRLGWKAYLGRDGGGADVSPYAAAARATDLTKLPRAYISVGTLDLFIDENIEYAQRLIQAGVPTELHVYPGAFHGFDLFAPSARVSKQFKADRDNALKRAIHDA